MFQPNEKFMRLAIEKAREGIKAGQTPFGACIVKDDKVICTEHNVVWDTTDITAHGEVNAIRVACKKMDAIDLTGCQIYSTCEPCPMCFSAIHWAKIDTIIFGASIQDAADAGFNELYINNQQMKEIGKSPLTIIPNFMQDECIELFSEWGSQLDKKAY